MEKDTIHTFISKARVIYGDKYDYSKVVYKNSRTKVEIVCHIHGSFWQSPNTHLSEHSCPRCGKERSRKASNRKDNNSDESFIEKAICVHEYKFNYQFIDYKNSTTKVKIKCNDCGTVFYQTPIAHLSGTSCRKCYLNKAIGANIYSWKGGVVKSNLPLYKTYAPQLEKYQPVFKIEQDGLDLLGVECTYCKKVFIPKLTHVQNRLNSVNGIAPGERNLYCAAECKKACPTYKQRKYHKGDKPNSYFRHDQKQWSKLVKERDNYTCQKCGTTKGTLEAHHIDPVVNNPAESADIANGITLCKGCHKEAHKIPGCSYLELQCKNNH